MYGEGVCLGKGFFLNVDNNFESIISNGGTGSSGISVVVIFSESFPGEHFMNFGWKKMVRLMARISKTKVPTNIFVKVFAIVSEQGLIIEKDIGRYITLYYIYIIDVDI